MELNTDILFEALSKIYKVEAAGCTLTNLSLDLPEHYLGGGSAFKKDHVYIARTDQLPPSPELEGPALLICLGGSPPNWYFNSEFSYLIKYKLFTGSTMSGQMLWTRFWKRPPIFRK